MGSDSEFLTADNITIAHIHDIQQVCEEMQIKYNRLSLAEKKNFISFFFISELKYHFVLKYRERVLIDDPEARKIKKDRFYFVYKKNESELCSSLQAFYDGLTQYSKERFVSFFYGSELKDSFKIIYREGNHLGGRNR